MKQIKYYIKLMRPKHYIKNLLIFFPLIFGGMLLNLSKLIYTLKGFIIFSLTSSVIYIINDIKDIEKDRKHNTKKNRPLAAGKITIKNALIELLIITLFIVIFSVSIELSIKSFLLLTTYFILNLMYSLGLKNIPLLDIVILVSGFIIRVLYGSTLININISNWLYLSVLTISFYLALGKRRNEINKNGSSTRKVLKYYNKEFLDKNMYMFLGMSLIFYSLWTTDTLTVVKNNNLLIWTVPLVVIICIKYSMNIEGNSDGDPVEVILKDKIIIILSIILIIFMFLILYIF